MVFEPLLYSQVHPILAHLPTLLEAQWCTLTENDQQISCSAIFDLLTVQIWRLSKRKLLRYCLSSALSFWVKPIQSMQGMKSRAPDLTSQALCPAPKTPKTFILAPNSALKSFKHPYKTSLAQNPFVVSIYDRKAPTPKEFNAPTQMPPMVSYTISVALTAPSAFTNLPED